LTHNGWVYTYLAGFTHISGLGFNTRLGRGARAAASQKLHALIDQLPEAMEAECGGDEAAARLVMHVMRQLWAWLQRDAPGLRAVVDLADQHHLAPLHKVGAAHRGSPLNPGDPGEVLRTPCICLRAVVDLADQHHLAPLHKVGAAHRGSPLNPGDPGEVELHTPCICYAIPTITPRTSAASTKEQD
jgi:hypothetical protein